MAVSVVVPTRDRPRALERCLRALARQSLAPLEVLVVDDASRDRAAVDEVVAALPGARLVRSAGAGPAAARNAGARAARGAVICLVDDDCEPGPDWAVRMTEAIEAGADAVAGRTLTASPGRPLDAASQAIVAAVSEATLDPSTGRLGFAPSCNLACRAELLATLPFDERFPLAAGEDREWCAAVVGRGFELRFEPLAVVAHRPELSAAGFLRQHVRYGRGAFRFHRGRPRSSAGLYPLLVRRGFEQGAAVGGLVLLAQAATAAGFAREALASRAAKGSGGRRAG